LNKYCTQIIEFSQKDILQWIHQVLKKIISARYPLYRNLAVGINIKFTSMTIEKLKKLKESEDKVEFVNLKINI
jgi:hypothetical protein